MQNELRQIITQVVATTTSGLEMEWAYSKRKTAENVAFQTSFLIQQLMERTLHSNSSEPVPPKARQLNLIMSIWQSREL